MKVPNQPEAFVDGVSVESEHLLPQLAAVVKSLSTLFIVCLCTPGARCVLKSGISLHNRYVQMTLEKKKRIIALPDYD